MTVVSFPEIAERELVERLLGRPSRVPFTVAKRCSDGTPQVIQTEPVFWEDEMWKPFPGVFWLLCPVLRVTISRLETDGFVKQMMTRLEKDHEFFQLFAAGQKEAMEWRMQRVRELLPNGIDERIRSTLEERNLVGSRSDLGVKCLHGHAAMFLVYGKNPIGEEVIKQVGDCPGIHDGLNEAADKGRVQ